ncbi:MAG: glycosyltransferase family 1 protein [Phycisphaerales bacterium]|nr:glycosyltransferase family 1 protein [Phycisphaerales bacterium]
MRIAAFQRRRWPAAVKAAGYDCVTLPAPPNSAYFQATLDDLIAHGRYVRDLLEAEPVDLIVDAHGDGMLFVDDPRERGRDALLHHHLGVPLFSHFSETLRILFRRIEPALLFEMLQSPTWHKGLFVRAHVAEMAFFGIPNCCYLPLAADDDLYPTQPPDVDHAGPLVFFAGHQQSRYFAHADGADTRLQRSGALALAAVADASAGSFLEAYRCYALGPEPAPDAPPADRAECARRYYAHKLFYTAARNLGTRDRFVVRLARQLGDRFLLVGDERWQSQYGLEPTPRLADDDYYRRLRTTPLCLNVVNGDNDTGLNLRPFEITAWGGLLLHYHQPELPELFDIGEECVSFRNEAELFDRIRHLAENPRQRDEIARAGQERTLREHLLHHRLATILDQVFQETRVESCQPS